MLLLYSEGISKDSDLSCVDCSCSRMCGCSVSRRASSVEIVGDSTSDECRATLGDGPAGVVERDDPAGVVGRDGAGARGRGSTAVCGRTASDDAGKNEGVGDSDDCENESEGDNDCDGDNGTGGAGEGDGAMGLAVMNFTIVSCI